MKVVRLRNPASVELVRILSDGNWYSSKYLKVAAGKYIAPEVASRAKEAGHTLSVERGRAKIMGGTLKSFVHSGRMEQRRNGRLNEYKLKDDEWARVVLAKAGVAPVPESITAPKEVVVGELSPTFDGFLGRLIGMKESYEEAKGKSTSWEDFLIHLFGSSLAGR